MPSGTYFLSPHSDDIVLSCTGLLLNEVLPRPYYMLTVFGNSTYVDNSQKKIYSGKNITDIRVNEDKLFAKELDINFSWLNLPDCLIRSKDVFFAPNYPIDIAHFNEVYKAVEEKVLGAPVDTIITHNPSGFRQHYDHRVVKLVAQKLCTVHKLKLFLVDDFPYNTTEINGRYKLIHSHILTTSELSRKLELMELYKSQMCVEFRDYIKKNRTERLFSEI